MGNLTSTDMVIVCALIGVIFVLVVLILIVGLNYLSPIIAGYFQVSTTVIKLIPILVIVMSIILKCVNFDIK